MVNASSFLAPISTAMLAASAIPAMKRMEFTGVRYLAWRTENQLGSRWSQPATRGSRVLLEKKKKKKKRAQEKRGAAEKQNFPDAGGGRLWDGSDDVDGIGGNESQNGAG